MDGLLGVPQFDVAPFTSKVVAVGVKQYVLPVPGVVAGSSKGQPR